MTLVAALFISSAAFAHDKDDKDTRKQEMIKHRTEQTVKDYNLNDEQAKQLLELNTKYADKMRPHRGRHHGPHGMKGKRPESPHCDRKCECPEAPKGDKKGERPEPPKVDMKEKRAEMAATMKAYETMKAYDEELQKIMTPEQYKNYKADMAKRHSHHKKGPRKESDAK